MKTELFNLMASFSHSSMKDRTVFMLLVIITLFQDPMNVEVKHISDQYWTMLRRWLTRMVVEKEEKGEWMDPVDSILPLMGNGINILPVMVNMFPIE